MTALSHRRRSAAGILAAGMAGLLALGACGVSSSGDAEPAGAPVQQADREGDGVAGAPDAPPQKPGDPQQAPTKVEAQQRSLIYTGSMTVRVESVVEAADRATDIAIGSGGVVAGDDRTLDADRSEARLVLRVPAERFNTVLDELARLGDEVSRGIQTQDVTEDLVDLDARLATQEASVERVRALLARAQTIGEIVSIESELTQRMAELDSLKQRRERLGGLVALSTITLNLRGPDSPGLAEPESGFLAGLKSGWAGFLASVEIVLTIVGWLLPFALVIGPPVWLLVWLLRRRRTRPATPAAQTPPTTPAGP